MSTSLPGPIHPAHLHLSLASRRSSCLPAISKLGTSCPTSICTSWAGSDSLYVPAGSDNPAPTEFEIDKLDRTKGLAHPRAHRGTVASHRPHVERGQTPPQLSKRQPCTVERKTSGLAHPRAHRGTVASHRPNGVKGMDQTLHHPSS